VNAIKRVLYAVLPATALAACTVGPNYRPASPAALGVPASYSVATLIYSGRRLIAPERTRRQGIGNNMTRAGFCHSQGEVKMADDKSKRGGPDRRRVAGDEGYEVNYFARKHGITKQQAEDLIKKVGNNREKLNAAAARLK
jgi:hypothetical protein